MGADAGLISSFKGITGETDYSGVLQAQKEQGDIITKGITKTADIIAKGIQTRQEKEAIQAKELLKIQNDKQKEINRQAKVNKSFTDKGFKSRRTCW